MGRPILKDTIMRRCGVLIAGLGLLVSTAGSALAHPHMWVDARGTIEFDQNGRMSAIHQSWTFDEPYSSWAIQGLDTNGDGVTSSEELQPLAVENMKGLKDYDFFTFAGEVDSDNIALSADPDPRMVYRDGRLTLDFTLRPAKPIEPGPDFQIEVTDPEYYVDFSFPDTHAVTMQNAPPGCSIVVNPPKEIDPKLAERLSAIPADVRQLPPDLEKAVQDLGNVVDLKCKGEASTASGAASQMARAKAPPFAAPPVEGGGIPRNAFLAWVLKQQSAFYGALTSAMTALKTDNNAFFVLGGLSFLYGIFHAAGPGHGKVVISSYLMASERQLRRGLALSFAAAMMQSVVAVAFIIVAALVLRMTSIGMSGAANVMAIGSYGLVALLGLWMIARKLFGIGHQHGRRGLWRRQTRTPREKLGMVNLAAARGRGPVTQGAGLSARQALAGDDHAGHVHHEPAHHHPHGYDHHHHDEGHEHAHHAVLADQTRGGWVSALGVVLAVGLRPCSGALIVLAFSLTQGVLLAGIAATFLMGLGTALTVSLLATVAVLAKGFALGLGRGENVWVERLVWLFELAGAVAVFSFGAILLAANI
ncbi:MAG TPA: DUF1007 family protein [Devosiaceae bacterium]